MDSQGGMDVGTMWGESSEQSCLCAGGPWLWLGLSSPTALILMPQDCVYPKGFLSNADSVPSLQPQVFPTLSSS